MERKWLEKLLVKSVVFALFLLVLLFIIKVAFVLYSGIYHGNVGAVKGAYEYVDTFLNGLRYDCRTVAAFSIIYFLCGLVSCWTRVSHIVLWFYALISVLIILFVGISEMVFFEIYNDAFNANLLGLIFDDQKAIFHTGISGQYSLTPKVIVWLVMSFVCMWIYTKIFSKITRCYGYDPLGSIRSRSTRKETSITTALWFVFFCLFMMVCINSAFSFRAVSLDTTVKPVDNAFLRKISPGAFRGLYIVYKGYARIMHSQFHDYIAQSPTEVVEEYFHIQDKQASYNLKDLLTHKVGNEHGQKIDHVFYIVAESLSEWHFNDEFDSVGLTSGLKSLLTDSHGVKIGVFLENAASTIKSMDVHLTGLLQTEIPFNAMLGTLRPFATAPAMMMKQLGYECNFYYGGSGIWQKLDQYTASQGFDRIYYNTQIVNNAKLNAYPAPYEGIWGAYDHHLFALIRDNIFKERNTPSFNMILTTSNHPPYDVPLEQFGAPIDEIAKLFGDTGKYKERNARQIAHIWYEDKTITRFIQEVSRVLPNSLFIITGDHYDREYPKTTPSLKAHYTIPLILYSPTLEIKKISNIGSHIDITPSMIELVAPHGFSYASFGSPLVSNDGVALSEKNSALGYFSVATDRFIYTKDGELEYFRDGIAQPNDKELAKSLYKRLQQATALSWWIFKNGYEIKDESIESSTHKSKNPDMQEVDSVQKEQ